MEKKNRASLIIIITLVVLIAVSGTVLAVTTINDKKEQDFLTTAVQTSTENAETTSINIDKQLEELPMYADGVKYYYATSSEQLQHDAMGATVMNNSDVNISAFVIAFCAFDANGAPIKIRQPDEQGEGAYVRTISYDLSAVQGDKKYINPGESFDNVVFYVTNDPQIVTIKACVKSYESVDKIKWNNPLYDQFKKQYSGKNLQ
ncbi:MAG: hypothetical protein IJR60_04775 [Eubacterium sp.]|nr:hypothetical protein [Eubacterium sp.]